MGQAAMNAELSSCAKGKEGCWRQPRFLGFGAVALFEPPADQLFTVLV
jgi:hypothetical protein